MRIILCDIDGTLAKTPFANDETVQYSNEFKQECWKSVEVYPFAIECLRLFNFFDCKIVLVTGRDLSAKSITREWLNRNEIYYEKIEFMPIVWKKFDEYIDFKIKMAKKYAPEIVLDDDIRIINAFKKELNIPICKIVGNESWKQIYNIINSFLLSKISKISLKDCLNKIDKYFSTQDNQILEKLHKYKISEYF